MNQTLQSRSRALMRRETIVSYLFLLPALFFFVGFVITPMAVGIITSFTDSHMGADAAKFIGLKNYIDLAHDSVFWRSLWNTFIQIILSYQLLQNKFIKGNIVHNPFMADVIKARFNICL